MPSIQRNPDVITNIRQQTPLKPNIQFPPTKRRNRPSAQKKETNADQRKSSLKDLLFKCRGLLDCIKF